MVLAHSTTSIGYAGTSKNPGHPDAVPRVAADDNKAGAALAGAEVTNIRRSAPACNPPLGRGHSPSRSPSSADSPSRTDPAASNSSDTPPTLRSEESAGDNINEGLRITFVLALYAYAAGVMIGILPETERIVDGWSIAPKVVYGILVVLTIALLAIGLMSTGLLVAAPGCHGQAAPTARERTQLAISFVCSKLAAIISSTLLVVAISCRLAGRWGCVAAVPAAAVIAGLMAAVWKWGDEHKAAEAISACWGWVVGPRRQRPLAGDEMV